MLFETIVAFVVILALLVLVHEAGHFFTARLFGVRADEFGFGFPPRAFGVQKRKNGKWKFLGAKGEGDADGGTVYSINWLPLGGFVKIKGEGGEARSDHDSFAARPIWQRGIILAAGVTMNVVLAFVLLVGAFIIGIPQSTDDIPSSKEIVVRNAQIQILEVEKDFPAAASLKAGDVLVAVDGKPIQTISNFQTYINTHRDGLTLQYRRGSDLQETVLKPKVLDEEDRAVIGVNLSEVATVSYPWYQAIPRGFVATYTIIGTILGGYWDFFSNVFSGQKIAAEVSGPVGIAVYTSMVVKLGFIYILQFTIVLSLNLAILNFLPIPALDGGRFLFLMIEKFRRRPVVERIENMTHTIGFALLMVLVVVLTYRDLARWGGDILRVLKRSTGL
ncbi:MAG TPA: M50 family metallopeptidase [Patescibacteria group bacterium]|nr:M50 family metallopeptidase [Patescibacteria group bacterium]